MPAGGVPDKNKKRSVHGMADDKKKNKFAEAFKKRFGDNNAKMAEKGKPIPPKRKK